MTESMIYWITRLDGIHNFCLGVQMISTIFAVLGLIVVLIATCLKAEAKSQGYNNDVRINDYICKIALKVLIPAFCTATICSLTRTFTPTTKEMIAIKVIPQITNVDNVDKIKDVSKDMLDVTVDLLNDMQKKYVNRQDK